MKKSGLASKGVSSPARSSQGFYALTEKASGTLKEGAGTKATLPTIKSFGKDASESSRLTNSRVRLKHQPSLFKSKGLDLDTQSEGFAIDAIPLHYLEAIGLDDDERDTKEAHRLVSEFKKVKRSSFKIMTRRK